MSNKTDIPMTYETLMSVHRQESKQTALAKIPSDFYPRTASYIAELENRCSQGGKEAKDLAGMLLIQLTRAKEKSNEIYEIRMRKIALMAMNSAFGGEPQVENATDEEMYAFSTLKDFFTDHCRKTLVPECSEIESKKAAKAERARAAQKKKEEDEEHEATKTIIQTDDQRHNETVLLRILEDLPPFAGVDRNYQLMKEDVISMPRNMADILLRKNKAVEVRQSS